MQTADRNLREFSASIWLLQADDNSSREYRLSSKCFHGGTNGSNGTKIDPRAKNRYGHTSERPCSRTRQPDPGSPSIFKCVRQPISCGIRCFFFVHLCHVSLCLAFVRVCALLNVEKHVFRNVCLIGFSAHSAGGRVSIGRRVFSGWL